MAEVIDGILIREVETKNIMTKSSLPVGGYSVMMFFVSTSRMRIPFITSSMISVPLTLY